MAPSCSSFCKAAQKPSPAVGDFSVDFRRLTAAYLDLLWLMVKVKALFIRGSANIVEEGVPDSD